MRAVTNGAHINRAAAFSGVQGGIAPLLSLVERPDSAVTSACPERTVRRDGSGPPSSGCHRYGHKHSQQRCHT
jgi:hypothetical protein